MVVALSSNCSETRSAAASGMSPIAVGCYSLIVPDADCGPDCPSHVASWEASFRRYAGLRTMRDCEVAQRILEGTGEGHQFLEFQRPLALLQLPQTLASYESSIGSKAMNMVRKARRASYTAEALDPGPYLQDIFEIR